MSKLAAAGVAVSGASAAAVGGTYLMNRESGIGEGKSRDPNPTSSSSVTVPENPKSVTGKLAFEDLKAFKSGMKDSDCVKNYFEEITDKTDASVISASSPDTSSFFKTPPVDGYQSCLFINGKVTTYGEDKWSGKFTWLWTFMSGDEGFITFNVAESSDKDDGKLKFSGVFYLVGKQTSDNQKWEIKHRKDMGDNREADSNNLDTYFPKAGNDLKGSDGDYWSFISETSKWGKSCKSDSCGAASTGENNPRFINKKFSFSKGNEQNKKLIEWSSDVGWWINLYSDIGWSLQNRTDKFTGVWTTTS